MKKSEFIDQIALGADISRLAAEKVLNSIIFRIIDTVSMNEIVQISKSIGIKFKPGVAFRDAVNLRR